MNESPTTDNRALTAKVVGAAIEVHSLLGPGFLESAYEQALKTEMALRGLSFEWQKQIPLVYKDVEIGEHRLDLFVEDELVVELKAVRRLEAVHYATVRAYLRATRCNLGLLINFNSAKLDVRRIEA